MDINLNINVNSSRLDALDERTKALLDAVEEIKSFIKSTVDIDTQTEKLEAIRQKLHSQLSQD